MRPAPILLASVVATASCSSASSPSGPPTFPAAPLTTMTSDSGALRIEVRTSPQPPARGTDSVELTVTSVSDGSPIDELGVDVVPWMPAMNHGTSAFTTVSPEGGGKYLVTNVDLFMPGHWELRTKFSGTMTDHAAPAFDIP